MSDIGAEELRFFDLYSRGLLEPDAIDEWVGRWHRVADQAGIHPEVHAYLGLSLPEYQLWVYDPDALPTVLQARRSGKPLTLLVEQRLLALASDAPLADQTLLSGLKAWLRAQTQPHCGAA